jgi:hypothetical protein
MLAQEESGHRTGILRAHWGLVAQAILMDLDLAR